MEYKPLNMFLKQTDELKKLIAEYPDYPIVVLLRKICISRFSNSSDGVHILLYFVCVIIATLLSIGIYNILERHFPKLKNILSGIR